MTYRMWAGMAGRDLTFKVQMFPNDFFNYYFWFISVCLIKDYNSKHCESNNAHLVVKTILIHQKCKGEPWHPFRIGTEYKPCVLFYVLCFIKYTAVQLVRGLEITEIPRDSKKMTELELERRACFVTKLLSVNDRIIEF